MAEAKQQLGDVLPLVASGKVRELYEVDNSTLLFVASDRISAYDVIMKNVSTAICGVNNKLTSQGVPNKGKTLTLMTAFWFEQLQKEIPELRTHFLGLQIPETVPQAFRQELLDRSMLVRKLKVFPLEAIVRGYITGSAWSSYKNTGQVNGKAMPEGMRESQEFPEPIFTPSTKAELGQHDENITRERAIEIVGEKYAKRIEELSLKIYTTAKEYAKRQGIIIADTKFEFGLDESTDEVVLIDEVLTPDSSRFWSARTYEVGRSQDSFDKQYLRDWLTANGLKGKDGVEMPNQVVEETASKYAEAFRILTGKTLDEATT